MPGNQDSVEPEPSDWHQEMQDEKFQNFLKWSQLAARTEGFYIGKWQPSQYEVPEGNMVEATPEDAEAIEAAVFAFQHLSEGMNVMLKRILRVNFEITRSILYYLTMEGSDDNFYEAKVVVDYRRRFNLEMIRLARFYPEIDPEILRLYDAPDDDE